MIFNLFLVGWNWVKNSCKTNFGWFKLKPFRIFLF